MRALLDTHTFLWWLNDDRRLSRTARDTIADEANPILVSAASAWEIATKVRKGKLPGAELLAADISRDIADQTFTELAVTVSHAQRAGALPGPLEDPFDRMLIAQAQEEDLVIVGVDRAFDHYRVTRLW